MVVVVVVVHPAVCLPRVRCLSCARLGGVAPLRPLPLPLSASPRDRFATTERRVPLTVTRSLFLSLSFYFSLFFSLSLFTYLPTYFSYLTLTCQKRRCRDGREQSPPSRRRIGYRWTHNLIPRCWCCCLVPEGSLRIRPRYQSCESIMITRLDMKALAHLAPLLRPRSHRKKRRHEASATFFGSRLCGISFESVKMSDQ